MTITLPDQPDTGGGAHAALPLLVVRTRVLTDATAEDLLGTILGAFANQPEESLRDEKNHPELVLEALPAQNLAEAEDLAERLRDAHPDEVPHRQRVKIVRLSDATTAERIAADASTAPDTTEVSR